MIVEVRNIVLRDGETLSARLVENGSPTWLVVTHGLGEHSGRHKHFFELYSQYFNVLAYDLRGHGKSTGKRGWAQNFEDFTKDLDEVLEYLKTEFKMNRYILFGHSMGGLITASYVQNIAKPEFYPSKVILSSPAVAAAGTFGKIFKISPMRLTHFLAKLPVTLPLGGMIDTRKLSHDALVYEEYIKDPLNILKIHSHLFFELIQHAREVFSRPLKVNCPLCVAIGTGDVIVGPEACIQYFSTIEKNANLVVIKNGYHELHNEVEKYREPFMKFLRESLLDAPSA